MHMTHYGLIVIRWTPTAMTTECAIINCGLSYTDIKIAHQTKFKQHSNNIILFLYLVKANFDEQWLILLICVRCEKLMSFLMFKTGLSSTRQTNIAIGFQFLDPNNVVSVHENVIIGSCFRGLITLRITGDMYIRNSFTSFTCKSCY